MGCNVHWVAMDSNLQCPSGQVEQLIGWVGWAIGFPAVFSPRGGWLFGSVILGVSGELNVCFICRCVMCGFVDQISSLRCFRLVVGRWSL